MKILETKELKKYYGKGDTLVKALDGVDLSVEDGEFVAIVGTSGSGKSTLLHMLGGLDRPTSGSVIVDGKDIFSLKDEALTIFRRRKIGFVFQSFNLVPVLTVRENIVLPIQLDGGKVDEDYVGQVVSALGLEKKLDNLPSHLSGGQQQRVAIARALVNRPKVLLLDEPLGALDLKLRKEMQLELKSMQQRLGITFIFVTHDQEEALTMSDTIVVMKDGTIQQIGDPKTIYDEPANAFVADFIGESNLLRGTMIHDELVEFAGTEFPCVDFGFGENTPVDVVVRPEDIMLVGEDVGQMVGTIKSVLFKGVHYEMMIDTGAYTFKVHSTTMQPQGSRVGLNIVPFNIHIMKRLEDTTPAAEVDAEC